MLAGGLNVVEAETEGHGCDNDACRCWLAPHAWLRFIGHRRAGLWI